MTIQATVIADSTYRFGTRITTVQLRYPRFIHSEMMTHRAFSRNASSSRAIPIDRLIEDVLHNTAKPVEWGSNQPGMQAGDLLDEQRATVAESAWNRACFAAVYHARELQAAGAHKQIVNRLIEPFAHINVLVTATDWDNFFDLRDHPDAQPEIRDLARAIRKAMDASEPEVLQHGEWHTPYVSEADYDYVTYNHGLEQFDVLKKISAAHCASVSYKTVDGKEMTVDKALEIYDKLAGSEPIHASPFEHIAKPWPGGGDKTRNFTKWAPWRAFIEEGENV